MVVLVVSLRPARAAGPRPPRLVLRLVTTFALVVFGWLVGALLAGTASADTGPAQSTRENPDQVAATAPLDPSTSQATAPEGAISLSIGPITVVRLPAEQPTPEQSDPEQTDPEQTDEQAPDADEPTSPLEAEPAQQEPVQQEEFQQESVEQQAVQQDQVPAEPPAQEATKQRSGAGLIGVVGAVARTVTSTVTTTVTSLTSTVGPVVTALPAILELPLQALPLPVEAIVTPIESGLDELIGRNPPTVTPDRDPVAADPATPAAPIAQIAAAPEAIPPARTRIVDSSVTAQATTVYATRTTVEQDDSDGPLPGGPILPFPSTPCAPAGVGPTATSTNDSGNSRGQQATIPSHPQAHSPPATAGQAGREGGKAGQLPGLPVTSPD